MAKLFKKEEKIEKVVEEVVHTETELEHLHKLHKELVDRNIRSISDLENQIARLQK